MPATSEYAVTLHVNEKLGLSITCDYTEFLGCLHVTTGFLNVKGAGESGSRWPAV